MALKCPLRSRDGVSFSCGCRTPTQDPKSRSGFVLYGSTEGLLERSCDRTTPFYSRRSQPCWMTPLPPVSHGNHAVEGRFALRMQMIAERYNKPLVQQLSKA